MIRTTSNIEPLNFYNPIPVICLDLKGNKLGEYESISKASRELNVGENSIYRNIISATCRCKSYIFIKKEKYKEGMLITYESLKRKKLFRKGKLKTTNISNVKYA